MTTCAYTYTTHTHTLTLSFSLFFPSLYLSLSSSGDSTARLWHIEGEGSGQQTESIVLSHQPLTGSQITSEGGNRDVTSVHWNVSHT